MSEDKVKIGDRVRCIPPPDLTVSGWEDLNKDYWHKLGTIIEIRESARCNRQCQTKCLAGKLMKVKFDDGIETVLSCWRYSSGALQYYTFKAIERTREVNGVTVRVMN